jgi:hypothetical protein
MRCISPYSNLLLHVLSPTVKRGVDRGGVLTEYEEGDEVIAQFRKMGLLEHEIEMALTTFNFSGLPDGVNPLTRIGAWDSESYCADAYEDDEKREQMQKKIDAALRKHAERYGPNMFLIVDQPLAQIPWPTYDDCTVEEILDFQLKLGIPAEKIRLYEGENKNRKTVVQEMLVREGDPSAVAALEEGDEEVREGVTVEA